MLSPWFSRFATYMGTLVHVLCSSAQESQIDSLIHSIHTYLLSIYYGAAVLLSAEDSAERRFHTRSAFPGLERSSGPGTCAHLAFDQLIVPLYLEHVARAAAHGAPGTVVAVTAGAVERSVLHGQLRAVIGLTCEVHAAEEERNKRVSGRFPAGRLHSSCKTKPHGLPLQISGG